MVLEERAINLQKDQVIQQYASTMKQLQEALEYADGEKCVLQERVAELEQVASSHKLALSGAPPCEM